MSLEFEWWHICIIVVIIFLAFLFTNYILKKINEARIEERLARLLQKASNNQSTQIHESVMKTKPTITHGADNSVSLVFEKDDNILQDYKKPNVIHPIKSKRELEDIKEITEKPEDTLSGNTTGNNTIADQSAGSNKIVLGSLIIKDSDDNYYASNSISLISQKSAETRSSKINGELKPIASNEGNQSFRMSTVPTTTQASKKADNILQDRLETKDMDIIKTGSISLVPGLPQKTEDELPFKLSNFGNVKQVAKETKSANLNVQSPDPMEKTDSEFPFKINNISMNWREVKETSLNNINVPVPVVMQETEERLPLNLNNVEKNKQEIKHTDTINPTIQGPDVLQTAKAELSLKISNTEQNSPEIKENDTNNLNIQGPDIIQKAKDELSLKISHIEKNSREIKEKETDNPNNQAPDVLEKTKDGLLFENSDVEKNSPQIQETVANHLNIQKPDVLEKTEIRFPAKTYNFNKSRQEVKETDATNLNLKRPDVLEKTEDEPNSQASNFEKNRQEIKAPDTTSLNIRVPAVMQKTEEKVPTKSNTDSNSQNIKESAATNLNFQVSRAKQKPKAGLHFKLDNSEENSHEFSPEISASTILEKIKSKVDVLEKPEATPQNSTLTKSNASLQNTEVINQNVDVPESSQIKDGTSSKINNSKVNLLKANDTESLNSEVSPQISQVDNKVLSKKNT